MEIFLACEKTKNNRIFVLPFHFRQARYKVITLSNLFQPIEFSLLKFDNLSHDIAKDTPPLLIQDFGKFWKYMFCCIHEMDSLVIFEKSNSEFHYIPKLVYQSSWISQVVKVLCRENYRAARRRRRFWGVFLSFLRAKSSKRFEVLRIPPPFETIKKSEKGGGILSDIVGFNESLDCITM